MQHFKFIFLFLFLLFSQVALYAVISKPAGTVSYTVDYNDADAINKIDDILYDITALGSGEAIITLETISPDVMFSFSNIGTPAQGDNLTSHTVTVAANSHIYLRLYDISGTGTNKDYNLTVSLRPYMDINDVSVIENNASNPTLTFTITIGGVSAADTTVDYTTQDGTAKVANNDYVFTSGTAVVPAGSTSTDVNVTIIGDTNGELDETFSIVLSNAPNAVINNGIGTGTILNDDFIPVQISISDENMLEGNSGSSDMNFTVTMDQVTTADIDIAYQTFDSTATTADNDYVFTSGILTIAQGSTSGTISVPIIGDIKAEWNEVFTVLLTLPDPSVGLIIKDTGIGNIVNDDTTPVVEKVYDICRSYHTEIGNKCTYAGGYYWGTTCDTSIQIETNNTETLQGLNIVKAYSLSADTTSDCKIDGVSQLGNKCDLVSPLPATESYINATSTSFGAGMIYDIDTINVETNWTIGDTDTSYSVEKIVDINLYSSYFKDGTLYRGEIPYCRWYSELNSPLGAVGRADIIDTPIITAADVAAFNGDENGTVIRYIQTKIAAQTPVSISSVHLDSAGLATPYDDNGSGKDFLVIPVLADDNCNQIEPLIDPTTNTTLSLNIPNGQISKTNSFTVPNRAIAASRFSLIAIDSSLLTKEGQNCLATSSTTGNLEGLAQCVNSEVQYYDAFGQDAVERCRLENGMPCLSNNGGYSNPAEPTYNPLYDNPLGCAMCTFNVQPVCSSDNFATRPGVFTVNIPANQVYRAESNNTLTFQALNAAATPVATKDYNETEDISFAVDLNISDLTKVCPDQSTNLTPDVVFTHGTYTNQFRFLNVGEYNISVHEINGSEFSIVDADDTPDIQRFVTPFKTNVKIIPDHFNLDGNLSNAGNGFTYLSNFELFSTPVDRNMSASMQLTITAAGEANSIMTNYTSTCYSKDSNLSLRLGTTLPLPFAAPAPLTKMLYYDVEHNTSGSVSLTDPLFFPAPYNKIVIPVVAKAFDGNDSNGSTTINYMLNFDRNRTMVVTPFVLEIDDLNISDTDDVNGSFILTGDKNATFVYGRAHAPRYRVDCNNSLPICARQLPIYYEIYNPGKLPVAARTTLSVDDVRWYRNTEHNSTTGNDDGNIATFKQRNAALLNDVNFTTQPNTNQDYSFGTFSYGGNKGYPYKSTIDMNASNWLIYNKFDSNAVVNRFELEFNSAGGWSGLQDTAATADLNASTNTNRRIEW